MITFEYQCYFENFMMIFDAEKCDPIAMTFTISG